MAEQKLDMGKAVLQLTNVVQTLTERLNELEAQRVRATNKAQVEVTGTDNLKVIKFVKSIYERKKYNAGGKIRSINVDSLEITKGGHTKVFITKTFNDGAVKSHPIIMWSK